MANSLLGYLDVWGGAPLGKVNSSRQIRGFVRTAKKLMSDSEEEEDLPIAYPPRKAEQTTNKCCDCHIERPARKKEENRHTTYRAAGRVTSDTSANTRWECSTAAAAGVIWDEPLGIYDSPPTPPTVHQHQQQPPIRRVFAPHLAMYPFNCKVKEMF
ncbi:hypothetical protein DAPPUDRAFT_235455 [Daphnia pulex]|uniref:Uncharacterized protein n=1 Tax=Daphnia pulex TaxID=6669 RepID=E9FZ06_DAPPU|nr:hypothetical protein DAPPUDRAFT_235455 [Daphnia pulex]|eukprot:EFX87624.1 hypothetical protein DAPPUDRAFT_235455 [Daphnia pulex]